MFWAARNSHPGLYIGSRLHYSLSKTTKLILLDSLLQEVCINSVSDWSLALSSLGLSVCLSQSQTSLFRAKESPLIYRIHDTVQLPFISRALMKLEVFNI